MKYKIEISFAGPDAPATLTSTNDTHVDDPDSRLVLADGFTYQWSMVNGQIPGAFEPASITFNLAARSMKDLAPFIDGTATHVDVSVWDGTEWVSCIQFDGTISDIGYEMTTGKRKARAQVTLVDTLAELVADHKDINAFWKTRGAPSASAIVSMMPPPLRLYQISRVSGRLIQWPAHWTDLSDMDDVYSGEEAWVQSSVGGFPSESVHELIQRNAWSRVQHGIWREFEGEDKAVFTAIPHGFGSDYPGYGYTDAIDFGSLYEKPIGWWAESPELGEWERSTWPMTREGSVRYSMVPTSRVIHFPFITVLDRLALDPVTYEWITAPVENVELAPYMNPAVIDACNVSLPLSAVQSRAHAVTAAIFEGTVQERETLEFSEGQTQYNGPFAKVYGLKTRTVQTLARVDTHGPTLRAVAAEIWADKDSLETNLNYSGGIPIHLDRLSDADAMVTLRALIPGAPGDYGDPDLPDAGTNARTSIVPVVIYNVEPELGLLANRVTGYSTAGTLTISDGKASYQVELAPGLPRFERVGNELVTAQDLLDGFPPWPTQAANEIGEQLTAADLLFTGAPL